MNWYETKDEDFASPMPKLRPPRLPKLRPPRLPKFMPRVLTFDEIRAILGTRQGGSFDDKRDGALVRMFFYTGARRREIAALRYVAADVDDRDVDLRRGLLHVLGKGGKGTPSHWLTRASWRSRTVAGGATATHMTSADAIFLAADTSGAADSLFDFWDSSLPESGTYEYRDPTYVGPVRTSTDACGATDTDVTGNAIYCSLDESISYDRELLDYMD